MRGPPPHASSHSARSTGRKDIRYQRSARAHFGAPRRADDSAPANEFKSSGRGAKADELRGKSQRAKQRRRRPRAPFVQRTLFPVLQTLIGVRIHVELLDDTIIDGVLDEAIFPAGNLTLVEANVKRPSYEPRAIYPGVFQKRVFVQQRHSTIHVRGSRLRCSRLRCSRLWCSRFLCLITTSWPAFTRIL